MHYRNILLPVDGSELSDKAVKETLALVKSAGAKVTVIHVISHTHLNYRGTPQILRRIEKEREEEVRQLAKAWLDRLVERIRSEGVDSEGVVAVGDLPYEEIISAANERQCDLIVMASHGHRGLDAVLIGSETAKVLTHSRIPVLVVR